MGFIHQQNLGDCSELKEFDREQGGASGKAYATRCFSADFVKTFGLTGEDLRTG